MPIDELAYARITVHAIVRYMEYALKIDTAALVAEGRYKSNNPDANIIASTQRAHPGLVPHIYEVLHCERNRKLLDFINRGEIRFGPYTLVVVDHCVVTLYPTHSTQKPSPAMARGTGRSLHRQRLRRALKNGELDEHSE